MSKNTLVLALGLALATAIPVASMASPAGQSDSRRVPGGQQVHESFAVMTVKSVDQKTRDVTLQLSDGQVFEFVAGDQIKNLAQLAPGQLVVVHYKLGMFVSLSGADATPVENQDTTIKASAGEGQLPAAVGKRVIDLSGTIMAVDTAAHTVTVKGPNRTMTLPVSEEISLDNLKAGDQISGRFTVSVAIRVEPAPDSLK